MHTVVVGTSGVTASDVLAVARGGARIELSEEAVAALAAAREIVDALAAKPEPVYGVSTGFGALRESARRPGAARPAAAQHRPLARRRHGPARGARGRPRADVPAAQDRLLRAHRCAGPRSPRPWQTSSTPGSPRSSTSTARSAAPGDLAPLSHCALTLMGEGDAEGPDGVVRPAGELLAEAGITPVELREKEGLALLNGTDGMLGMLVMALADLEIYKSADVTAALSLEALLGTDKVLAPSCTPSARTRDRAPAPPTCWPS